MCNDITGATASVFPFNALELHTYQLNDIPTACILSADLKLAIESIEINILFKDKN